MHNQGLEYLSEDDQHEVFEWLHHLYLKSKYFFVVNQIEDIPITAPASREVINKRISIPDADE
jgi:hypothetical protein